MQNAVFHCLQYCGMVVGLDLALDQLVEFAKENLGEDTIVVVSSDNGGSVWFECLPLLWISVVENIWALGEEIIRTWCTSATGCQHSFRLAGLLS